MTKTTATALWLVTSMIGTVYAETPRATSAFALGRFRLDDIARRRFRGVRRVFLGLGQLLLKLGIALFQLGNACQGLRKLRFQLGHFLGQPPIIRTAFCFPFAHDAEEYGFFQHQATAKRTG